MMSRVRIFAAVIGLCGCLACGPACVPALAADTHGNDPFEGFNRGIFWFNDQVDTYVLEPVAKGWDWLLPDRVERSLDNFFENLRFPVRFVNDVLQAKPVAALGDVGRFAVNTTVGVAGFFDPATDWGLPLHDEDFGQTLGYWGVPPGPYLVLPLLGPSNPRDTAGYAVDVASTIYPWFVDWEYTIGVPVVSIVNTRALALDQIRQIKEASLDYYVAVRRGYEQHRESQIRDGAAPTSAETGDLYSIDPDSKE